jgi:streptogramin lyase
MGTRARLVVLLCAAAAGAAGTANADLLPVDTAILEEAVPPGWVWDDFTTGYLAPTLGIQTVDPVLTEYTLPEELAVPHGISKEPGNTSFTQSNGPNVWFSTLGEEFAEESDPHVVRLDPQTGDLTVFTVPDAYGDYVAVPDLFVQPDKVVWGEATEEGEDNGDLFFVDPKTNTGRIYDTNIRLPDQMFIDQQGNIWGVEAEGFEASRIWVFNQKTGQLFRWDVSAFGFLPRSIIRRRNGDVWFTFRFPPAGELVTRIGRLDPKTNVFTFYPAGMTPAVGFDRIETIRADPNNAMGAPDGRLWVTPGFVPSAAEAIPDAIGVLDPATLTFTRYNLPPLSENGDPYGLAMGCAGSVAFGEDNGTSRKLGLLVPDQSTPDGTETSIPTVTDPIAPATTILTPMAVDFAPVPMDSVVATTNVDGTVIDGILEVQTNAGGDEGPHLTVMGPNERIVASLPNPITFPRTYRIALLELPPSMRCNKVS